MRQKYDKNLCADLVKEARNEDISRYVVGGVISKKNRVLLLQRPPDEFMGGIYELPSGEVEIGESLEAALGREVLEETGIGVKKIKSYLGHFDYSSKKGNPTRQFNFEVSATDEKIRLTEHKSYTWAGESDLSLYSVTDSVKSVLKSFWG